MRGLNTERAEALKEHLSRTSLWPDISMEENCGISVIQAKAYILVTLMKHLKSDPTCRFNVLIDLTAVDYLDQRPAEQRFDIVYLLWSTDTMQRVRVKVTAAEGEKVPSVSEIWKGANWPEREVFDLFGIEFSGHPVMERIIMPENFRGYPLRKDFPLEGTGGDYLIESILIEPSPDGSGD